jgi:hypothetical protein
MLLMWTKVQGEQLKESGARVVLVTEEYKIGSRWALESNNWLVSLIEACLQTRFQSADRKWKDTLQTIQDYTWISILHTWILAIDHSVLIEAM